jgi:hypothetical protein
MIRGHSHLTKYISTPADARRFVSDNPEEDLNADGPDNRESVNAPPVAPSLGGLAAANQHRHSSSGSGGLTDFLRRGNAPEPQILQKYMQLMQQPQGTPSNLSGLLQLVNGGGGGLGAGAGGGMSGLNLANLAAGLGTSSLGAPTTPSNTNPKQTQSSEGGASGGNNMLLDALRNPQRRSSTAPTNSTQV